MDAASIPIKMGWNPIDNMCANTTPSLDEELDHLTNTNNNTVPSTSTNTDSSENNNNKTALTEQEALALSTIAPITDLSRPDRIIWVVTTAALPWRTGTSVNPLARALYLTRGRPKHAVTLMIPFLPSKEEQKKVFGDTLFETQEEQEAWIRDYCKDRVHCGGMFYKLFQMMQHWCAFGGCQHFSPTTPTLTSTTHTSSHHLYACRRGREFENSILQCHLQQILWFHLFHGRHLCLDS